MEQSLSHGYTRSSVSLRSHRDRDVQSLPLEAYKKAAKIMEERDDIIDPTTFRCFDPALIRADKIRVVQKKADIQARETLRDREIKRYSDIFELIFIEQTELSDWLGSGTVMHKASEYDDLFHGIDAIAEFSKPKGLAFFTLAIDVTSSEVAVEKKLRGIKQSIDNRHLAGIRHFQSFSPDGSSRFEGSLSNVPKAIVAIDREVIAELAKAWIKSDTKTLAHYPVQWLILEQLELQMEAFLRYAQRTHRNNLAAPLAEVLKRVREIKQGKKKVDSTKPVEAVKEDRMLKVMKTELGRTFR